MKRQKHLLELPVGWLQVSCRRLRQSTSVTLVRASVRASVFVNIPAAPLGSVPQLVHTCAILFTVISRLCTTSYFFSRNCQHHHLDEHMIIMDRTTQYSDLAEVMEQIHGYDYKADLWSLGITALELAKGYAPYARYPPMKVLILTIQEDPPSLDTYDLDDDDDYNTDNDGELEDTDDRHERHGEEETWSPNFRQLVSWLLQKNPAQRPTCEELLQSSLLSTAVSQNALESQICAIVPDVGDVTSKQRHGHQREGENHQQDQEQQQQEYSQHPPDFMLGSRRQDAVCVATNSPRAGGGHHQDRAPGTTWIFADGSQVLASTASLEERDTDDLLSELDQFCGATGGENYRKEATATTTLSDSAPYSSAKGTTSGTMEDLIEEFEFKMEAAKAADEDDLDEFLDEFEKTTAGENFQRPL